MYCLMNMILMMMGFGGTLALIKLSTFPKWDTGSGEQTAQYGDSNDDDDSHLWYFFRCYLMTHAHRRVLGGRRGQLDCEVRIRKGTESGLGAPVFILHLEIGVPMSISKVLPLCIISMSMNFHAMCCDKRKPPPWCRPPALCGPD